MDKTTLPEPSIMEFTAFYTLNLLTSKDLVDYACKTLEQGVDSESLITLAGEVNPELSEAGPLFERALAELKIPKPTKLDAQLTIAHYYAKAIQDGSLTPYEGARKIWWEISNEIEKPAEILLSFVGAASEIEDLPERYKDEGYDPTPQIEEYKKDIIEASERLLKIQDSSQLLATELLKQ